MNVLAKLEKLCLKLGEGSNAALVASCIATAKGIFRPLFTMADKKEKPVTKKYTAIREFLTEVVAIPVYLGSGALANKLTKTLSHPKYYLNTAKKELHNVGKEVNNWTIGLRALELARENKGKLHANLALSCAGLAAFLVIPALSSTFIKPFMKYIQPSKGSKNTEDIVPVYERPAITRYDYLFVGNGYNRLNSFPRTSTNIGMKVGGV